jgi:chemotaxis protein MotA
MIMMFTQFLTTIAGLIIIAAAFYFVLTGGNGDLADLNNRYFHAPSAVLIFISLLGLLLCSFRINKVFRLIYHLLFRSRVKLALQHARISSQLREISDLYYSEGAPALGKYISEQKFPQVWHMIFEKLEANIDPNEIKDFVSFSAQNVNSDFNSEVGILKTLSQASPSIGVLGTVMGLIKLLSELDDFSKLGPNMSLALVTTLYGLFASILLINPLIARMEDIRDSYLKFYDQAIFWLHLIENQMPSFFVDKQNLDNKS